MKIPVVSFLSAAVALSACASSFSTASNPAPCPGVGVLVGADRVIEFDGAQDAENVAYSGEIIAVDGTCRYWDGRPIEQRVTVDLSFGRGPKGRADEHEFAYFIAVTRTDLEVIHKETFPVKVKFGDRRAVVDITEKINNIVIPRANETISGANFEVLVGFEMSSEQLAFNRSGKSLKFPEL